MAIQVEVPTLGESVTQAVLLSWHKQDGEQVAAGEPLCELETDKANVDIPAPTAGVLRRGKKEGDTVKVGEVVAQIEAGAVAASTAVSTPAPAQPAPASKPIASSPPPSSRLEDSGPAARRMVEEHQLDPAAITGTGKGGRITKEDVVTHMEGRKGNGQGQAPAPPGAAQETPWSPPAAAPSHRVEPAPRPAVEHAQGFDASGVRVEPMSKIRRRIAENLLRAQQTAAILTTFNEVDMTAVLELRAKWKEQFEKVHGVGLGFMSFFARACVQALMDYPHVNAFIDGDNLVFHNYVHLGIAVSTERGLAVPVLKNAHQMSFAKIESEIKRLATATRDGKLGLDELSGGTFTITNGGVFGSLLSTPILNPPQSGILGMHTIQKRPVAIDDKVVIRPMMYLALSYDHRIVDGRAAIGFLVRIKQLLEDPARLMLGV